MVIVPLLKDLEISLPMFFFINVLIISIAYTPFSFMSYGRYVGLNVSVIPKNSSGVSASLFKGRPHLEATPDGLCF
jgi:hypothetical protein